MQRYKFFILELKGQILILKGNYNDALPIYLEYAKLVDAQEADKTEQAEIHSFMNLGGVFYKLAQYDIALKFYNKAQNILAKLYGNKDPKIMDCLKATGNIYLHLEQFDKASQNF